MSGDKILRSMKSYMHMTEAYLVANGLGQVWVNDAATNLEKLIHVNAARYKRLKATGRIVRRGFTPYPA